MDRIRQWIRQLAIKLYDLSATKEESQFWYLEKQAADAAFWMKKYRTAVEDLEAAESTLIELQAAKPVVPKKKAGRKKAS